MLGIMSHATPASSSEVVAAPIGNEMEPDAACPTKEWQAASPISFCSDWRGENPDPSLETEVRVLWSRSTLYLRFVCRYRELHVFDDADSNGRRDQLWDRDVAEAFLQPDPSRARYYKEFEIAPNGFWIDLDISPGPLADLKSGLRRSVWVGQAGRVWAAELAIPIKSLTANFDPAAVWRINFYRVEGRKEPRAYLAWCPTNTAQPNFHVPDAFGKLRFGSPR
jgi:alpha-galactosidase